MDRRHYPTRKLSLADEQPAKLDDWTPAQRLALVWSLTVNAWTFKDGGFSESRLRRDVVRVVRSRR